MTRSPSRSGIRLTITCRPRIVWRSPISGIPVLATTCIRVFSITPVTWRPTASPTVVPLNSAYPSLIIVTIPFASTTTIHSPAPASTSSSVRTRARVEPSSRDILSISVMSWKIDTAPKRMPPRKIGDRLAMTVRAPIGCGRPVSGSPVRRTFTSPEFGTMERSGFPTASPFSTPRRRAAASLNTRIVPSRSMAITPLAIESRARSRNVPWYRRKVAPCASRMPHFTSNGPAGPGIMGPGKPGGGRRRDEHAGGAGGPGVLRGRRCAGGNSSIRRLDPQLGAGRAEPRRGGGADRQDDPADGRRGAGGGGDLRGPARGSEEGPGAARRAEGPPGRAGGRGGAHRVRRRRGLSRRPPRGDPGLPRPFAAPLRDDLPRRRGDEQHVRLRPRRTPRPHGCDRNRPRTRRGVTARPEGYDR